MTKFQFAERLAARLGITFSEAEKFLNTTIGMVYEVLAADPKEKIQWSGFGTFSVSHRASRIGVNPRNPSQKITIPELNTPKFKAGEAFKEAIKLRV